MSVLRVENLSKRYGKKQVLKGITCEFHTGINALLQTKRRRQDHHNELHIGRDKKVGRQRDP